MPIVESDIKIHLSTRLGSSGLSQPQTNPNHSLGKFISTTEWLGGVLHDLFDPVTGDENAQANAEYRCVFVRNSHGTLTWENVVMWLTSEVAGGASIAVGVDPTPATPANHEAAQAVEVANEDTAPAGVTFSTPTSKAAGVSLGSIGPQQCRAVWLRRTPLGGGAVNEDAADIRWEGDTAA